MNGIEFSILGGKDVFFGCLDANGAWRWALSGGSVLDDEIAGVTIDGEGNHILAGAFWFSAAFGSIALEAGTNPKGIFLLKVSPLGEVSWGVAVNGTGLKGAGGVGTDQQGNIWLTGYFGGELLIGDTTLTASGQTNLFLAKFNPQGQLIWALREGISGDTRAQAIAIKESGQAVIGGYFNGQTSIAGSMHTANTSDRDVFIAAYDLHGQGLWSRKAGGVHDDDISAIALDEEGHIYAAGYLVGVMSLGNGISIQSATGNPDFYLLKYAGDGNPLLARALGGPQSQLATGLSAGGGRVFVCGQFQGGMGWDGLTLSSQGPFAGFYAAFDAQLEGIWAQALTTTQGVYPHSIALDPNGRLWTAGSFSGSGQFPNGMAQAVGPFDGFIMHTALPVQVASTPTEKARRLYPNPVSGMLFIDGLAPGERVHIYSSTGKPCAGPFHEEAIDVSSLSTGYYVALISGKHGRTALPFVKASP